MTYKELVLALMNKAGVDEVSIEDFRRLLSFLGGYTASGHKLDGVVMDYAFDINRWEQMARDRDLFTSYSNPSRVCLVNDKFDAAMSGNKLPKSVFDVIDKFLEIDGIKEKASHIYYVLVTINGNEVDVKESGVRIKETLVTSGGFKVYRTEGKLMIADGLATEFLSEDLLCTWLNFENKRVYYTSSKKECKEILCKTAKSILKEAKTTLDKISKLGV